MFRIIQIAKDLFLSTPLPFILYPVSRLFRFLHYMLEMHKWIYRNKKLLIKNPGFTLRRDYTLRYKMYEEIVNFHGLKDTRIIYLEFGVASGSSMKWWYEHNIHPHSRFFGFDTFEGLPEAWAGLFNKGDMKFDTPQIDDSRVSFIKGLFQDTLNSFIEQNKDILKSEHRLIIHCDADLYSSTIFVLSQLYSVLKKGDIIFFDEFNVPLHEFKAYKDFADNFYVSLKPEFQVNNFYQLSFIVE